MKTISIIHGWAGGKWHTADFENELEKAEFNIIEDSRKSDIIFAHSAGCYKIPSSNQARLVVLIGVPYWPGKSILKRFFIKTASDGTEIARLFGYRYASMKLLWQVVYGLAHPEMAFAALKNHDRLNFFSKLEEKKVIVIHNQNDVYSSSGLRAVLKNKANLKYIDVPGLHDDYYTNPRLYVDLIIKEL